MEYKLNIDDEVVDILEEIAGRMKLPADLSKTERMELVIGALAESADTAMDVAYSSSGTPVELQDAIEKVLNPDISTSFVQPNTQAEDKPPKQLGLQELLDMGAMHGKPIDDPIMQEAVVIVMNQLDKEDWNTPKAKELVEKVYAMVKEKIQGDSTKND